MSNRISLIQVHMIKKKAISRKKNNKLCFFFVKLKIYLQYILFRLAQSEIPHESLCHFKTVQTLIRYLCCTRKASKRAGRILLKLSKNLYCLMPIVNQRIFSWLKPEIGKKHAFKKQYQFILNFQFHEKRLLLLLSGSNITPINYFALSLNSPQTVFKRFSMSRMPRS